MGSEIKAKRISKGHYEYRGYWIHCCGYYPPEQRVVWECIDKNGSGFGHDFSLKGCKHWIDEEIKRDYERKNQDTVEKLNACVERSSNKYPLDNYNNPITTQEHINELHRILVQTCLNYMKKHELTDIDEISFSANGLSSSYEYNEWTPATDSSLTVVGLQEESKEDKYIVRKIIGESF